MEIAVLVPCYNEELTVEKVISDFNTYLPEAKVYVNIVALMSIFMQNR